MNPEKLNELVLRYQCGANDDVFREIYEITAAYWRPKAKEIAQSIRADTHDVEELYDDVLMKCVETYDGKIDFEHYFKFCAKNARADLYRKKSRIAEHETYELDSDAATFEIRDEGATPEEIATQTKEADQLQLIDFLTKDCDEPTTAIVETSLRYPPPKQSTGRPKTLKAHVADVLGIDKRTVSRKFERLAANFDYKQFGDYRDYLLAR